MNDGNLKPRRGYRLQRRAESQIETRRRITEVAVQLHGTVGPAQTTIAEVARRAGVQRLTVYRHFPDERALFEACTAHWLALHPFPTPEDWAGQPDAPGRCLEALRQVYVYYRQNERMIANWLRDAQLIPALKQFADEGYYGYLGRAAAAIVGSDGRLPAAGLLLALHFETWRILTAHGKLGESEAASLMTRCLAGATD